MKVYYEKDADLSLIKGKKSRSSAMAPRPCACAEPQRFRREGHGRPAQGWRILGQGEEGRPQGRRSRRRGEGRRRRDDADARRAASPTSTRAKSNANIKKGAALAFAHGFNIHYGQVMPARRPRRGDGRAQGAGPHGARDLCRRRRRADLIAVHQDASRAQHVTSRSRTRQRSAAAVPASSRPTSAKKPKPTCSANKPCSAAAWST